MALLGAIRAWNCSAANWARTGRISAMWNRIPIEQCTGQVGVCYPLDCRPGLSGNIGLTLVESECGAVVVGRTYLFPPLSSGGASLAEPWLRFHIHRVTGGGHPPPVPTERGVRISRTNALRKLVHSTASACSSEYGRRSLGVSNGVRSLIWLKASQVRRRPAQLRLQHPAPVTLHDPIYFDETPKISGDAVISIVAA